VLEKVVSLCDREQPKDALSRSLKGLFVLMLGSRDPRLDMKALWGEIREWPGETPLGHQEVGGIFSPI
jgi:hypothetical protein